MEDEGEGEGPKESGVRRGWLVRVLYAVFVLLKVLIVATTLAGAVVVGQRWAAMEGLELPRCFLDRDDVIVRGDHSLTTSVCWPCPLNGLPIQTLTCEGGWLIVTLWGESSAGAYLDV
jgi:hypothetical protein